MKNTGHTPATDKQLAYLLALVNKAEGSSWEFLSQTQFGKRRLTMQERNGIISKARASALIDELKGSMR